MARLIDADAFAGCLERMTRTAYPNLFPGLMEAMEYAKDFPTVDAVEVVHGRWEWLGPYRHNDDGMIGTCSVCKERLRVFSTNYCPNCGAKMDGGNSDD